MEVYHDIRMDDLRNFDNVIEKIKGHPCSECYGGECEEATFDCEKFTEWYGWIVPFIYSPFFDRMIELSRPSPKVTN